jgi:peptidoglycan/xylan/chitin deacetylase (PgdA/CDA1 family)
MAPTFRRPAPSLARRLVGVLRPAIALVLIGALSTYGWATLASRQGSTPTGEAENTASPAVGTLAGASAPQSTAATVQMPPTASEPPPRHGAPPPPSCLTGPSNAAQATVVRHGSRAKKVVALTFDDGYNASNVRRILAILERSKVNATFFPTSLGIRSAEPAWRAVALAGFPIANHTYDHKDLKTLCQMAQLTELELQDRTVAKDLGLTVLPYMRPPYGDYDDATRFAAAEDGEQAIVLWDVDTRDWTGISWRSIAARASAGTNGSIVIMHTSATNTVTALPTIIARYRARGFTFVTVGQLLGIDGPTPFK